MEPSSKHPLGCDGCGLFSEIAERLREFKYPVIICCICVYISYERDILHLASPFCTKNSASFHVQVLKKYCCEILNKTRIEIIKN